MRRARLGRALAVPSLLLLAVPATGSTAYAGTLPDCSSAADQTTGGPDPVTSQPIAELDVQRAALYAIRNGHQPGAGVTVAVVDSGIADLPGRIRRDPRPNPDIIPPPDDGQLTDPHGTVVAGLIGGAARGGQLVGIAPRADLIDLRVYDTEGDGGDGGGGDDGVGIEADNVDKALQRVLDLKAANVDVDIVNLSVPYGAEGPDDRTAQLIRRLWADDVIVVAATGDRMLVPGLGDDFDDYRATEDVAGRVFPAAYPLVVGVNATAEGADTGSDDESDPASPDPTPTQVTVADPSGAVYASTDTDLAVPTAGGVSYALDGAYCAVSNQSTGWAAAEVTGILALLKSAHPTESNQRLIGRLLATASGLGDGSSGFLGAGVADPYDAISTTMQLDARGRPVRPTDRPDIKQARLSAASPDPLGDTRHDVVWWALGGAGGLALTLLLAPVLSRRRRASTAE